MADKNIPDLSTLLAVNLVGGSVMEWYDATSSTNRKMTYTELATLFAPAAPFTDTNALVKGSSDTTKLMRFEVDGFTTGTTRVLTPPDSNITLAGIDINQTFTGVQTFTPAARSSGSASAFTFNTPADTGTTASTERIEFSVPGAIVTWATGNVTTQRFNVWGADTVAAAGASTFTTVVGNEFLSPVAGTNVTIPSSYAGRFVASSATHVPLVAKGASSQSGNLQEWQNSSGSILAKVSSSGQITGTGSFTLTGGGGIINAFNGGFTGVALNADVGNQLSFTGTSYTFTVGNTTGALNVKGAASRTVGVLNLQTSAGGSLGNVGGCIFDDFTDTASTHTDGTFDTLLTHTTVANTLAVNGDKVNFECTLSIVGHAVSTDQIKVSFAGITIFDSGAINYASNTIIKIRGSVMRKTSTTCRATVDFIPNSGTPLVQYTPDGTLTGLTLTSTNILAVTAAATGTNSASGDVTAVMNSIGVIPAGS